jgi:probable HAF family extracellular repeat protein
MKTRTILYITLFVFLISPLVCADDLYEAFEIPADFGLDSSRAYGVNDAGDVVGRIFNEGSSRLTNHDISTQAFVWNQNDGLFILPALSVDSEGTGWDINNSRQISGFSQISSGNYHAVRWDYDNSKPVSTVLSQDDFSPNDLGVLSANSKAQSFGYGINESGNVVGRSDVGNPFPYHAFLHNTTTMDDLETFMNGSSYSIAYDINNNGSAVGIAQSSSDTYDAFYFDGTLQALKKDVLRENGQWNAVALNDTNMIGGHVYLGEGSTEAGNYAIKYAYYWTDFDVAPIALDTPEGLPYSEIFSINSSGQMVGLMWDESREYKAFLFDTVNGVRDLNDLLVSEDKENWILEYARDINDFGQIVGFGDYNGQARGYLLTVTPEPLSCILFPIGLGAFGIFRRKKGR